MPWSRGKNRTTYKINKWFTNVGAAGQNVSFNLDPGALANVLQYMCAGADL